MIVELPFKKPPLSLNDRLHWRVKARIVADLRTVTKLRARASSETFDAAQVTLHYRPRDRRTRDTDNPGPTLKACIDGLVDAGVLTKGDGSEWVKSGVVIHPAIPGRLGELWLEVLAMNDHDYVSTACQHDLHEQCRRECKFCQEPCQCPCHTGSAA